MVDALADIFGDVRQVVRRRHHRARSPRSWSARVGTVLRAFQTGVSTSTPRHGDRPRRLRLVLRLAPARRRATVDASSRAPASTSSRRRRASATSSAGIREHRSSPTPKRSRPAPLRSRSTLAAGRDEGRRARSEERLQPHVDRTPLIACPAERRRAERRQGRRSSRPPASRHAARNERRSSIEPRSALLPVAVVAGVRRRARVPRARQRKLRARASRRSIAALVVLAFSCSGSGPSAARRARRTPPAHEWPHLLNVLIGLPLARRRSRCSSCPRQIARAPARLHARRARRRRSSPRSCCCACR